MLKKMRWRFVAAAMAAIITVVLVLLCAINVWYYVIVTRQQDNTLVLISNLHQAEFLPFGNGNFKPPGQFGGLSIEQQYMMRFFFVTFDQDENITSINAQSVSSLTPAEAAAHANEVLQSKRNSGYYDNYRYLKTTKGSEVMLTFLYSERELATIKYLLQVSGIVAFISLIAVFILVILFSTRAIAPYVRNIQTQKRFITDAGHELKTPLTAIVTSADVLAMENPGNEWITNIQHQSSRLSKLITNLVTLSRLDEDKPFSEQTSFSLSDALWEISESIQSIAYAKGKHYECDIEKDLSFYGNKNEIQQVVSILLDNAIKYSDDEGKINLSLHKKQRKMEILVSNTCKPDLNMDIKRIFDRFYRPDQSRSTNSGGTGVGLSIAKATIESQGGKISVKQIENSNGTVLQFSIIL